MALIEFIVVSPRSFSPYLVIRFALILFLLLSVRFLLCFNLCFAVVLLDYAEANRFAEIDDWIQPLLD